MSIKWLGIVPQIQVLDSLILYTLILPLVLKLIFLFFFECTYITTKPSVVLARKLWQNSAKSEVDAKGQDALKIIIKCIPLGGPDIG